MMGIASLHPSYGRENSQHLMHVDDDAIGGAGGGADEEAFHQPATRLPAGFDARGGADMSELGIDGLAALELLQQLDGPEAQALVLDIDPRAVVGLEGVF